MSTLPLPGCYCRSPTPWRLHCIYRHYTLENDDDYPTFILTETAFRSIHSDPRWPIFLEELGLLEYLLEMSPDSGH